MASSASDGWQLALGGAAGGASGETGGGASAPTQDGTEHRSADVVFAALADPTRRHLLEEISERGPTSATDLAAGLPISRQAVVKHLGALAGAGLVRSQRRGREVLFAVEADQLGVATEWLDRIGRVWDERLAALVKHLST